MAESKSGLSSMLMMFAFILVIFMMFDRGLREATGKTMNYVLYPLIGFNNAYPILTLFLAGLILVFLSTLIRHLFIDSLKTAKIQKQMSAYQKELRSATLSQNMYRVKKLKDMQPEIMKVQAEMSTSQMKPMAFTMLVAIPIFLWLSTFVSSLPADKIIMRAPWDAEFNLMHGGPFTPWHLFPQWIILYAFMTMPFGQVFQKLLKAVKYRKILREGK
ncbi:MAG: EMC3/TMCO1 family protein [Thermoplasmatales archaeon]|nr:EMC3/TMCO1 family protein [Thermoplasmatales archaeon]